MRTMKVWLMRAALLTVAGMACGQTPLLRYTFDEASSGTTTVLDQGSGTAANGSFVNSATRTANTPGGLSKGALDLATGANGVNHYVSGGNAGKLNALTNLTITAWINMRDNAGAGDRLVAWNEYGEGVKGFDLQIPSGATTATAMKLTTQIQNSSVQSTASFNAFEQWVFIAMVWNNTQVKFYTGGEAAATVVTQLGTTVNYSKTDTDTISGQLQIGGSPLTAADRTPPAWMDDVRIYDVALSQAQLEAIRRDNILPKGMVIWIQ